MTSRRIRVIFEVISQEYTRRVSSGAFFASTLIGTLIVILLASLPSLAPALEHNGVIGVQAYPVSLTGNPKITAAAKTLIESDKLLSVVAEREKATGDRESDLKQTGAHADLRFILNNKNLSIVVTTGDVGGAWKSRLRTLLPLAASLKTGKTVTYESSIIRLPYTVIPTVAHSKMSAQAQNTEQAIASLLIGGLYGSILVGSQILMGGVTEEKTNRIAEMLAAIANPRDLLAGKIFAAAALAVTQGIFWTVGGVAAYLFTSRELFNQVSINANAVQNLPPLGATIATIVTFVVLAPLGYLQFASMYAGSAALVSRPEDASMLTAPLALPVGGAALAGVWSAAHPESTLATVTSFAPFTSAFAMTARVGAGQVETWEILMAIVIQIAATALLLESAARVYRVGLTLYGRFPSLKQVLNMMKQA